jgi:hypothetical protein
LLTLRRLVGAAALLVGAVVPVGLASPAHAAACTGDGVTVVVDPGSLGGQIAETCVAGGGGEKAAQLFSVSHSLTRVQRFPGAVCKVDGLPGSAGCVAMPPANAYWGLFWSDGSGGWTFSSTGVDALTIPNGGAVAFRWQSSTTKQNPGVAAPVAPKTSTPTPPAGPVSPTTKSSPKPKKHTQKPATHPAQANPTAPTTTAASTTPTTSPSASTSTSPTTSPSTSAAATLPAASSPTAPTSPVSSPATAPAADAPATSDGGGLPGWVPPVLVVVVLAAGGGIAVVRRRRS